jgi:hypothetical protein
MATAIGSANATNVNDVSGAETAMIAEYSDERNPNEVAQGPLETRPKNSDWDFQQ